MLLLIRELVEDHDFEGLELDWLRCPFCMDPPATPEQIDDHDELDRRIRKLTAGQGAARPASPIRWACASPSGWASSRRSAWTSRRWPGPGLIDFVNFSNSWQTSWDVPYDELRRELGDKVAIYGVIEDAPTGWTPSTREREEQAIARLLSASPELLRGNAAGKLAHGRRRHRDVQFLLHRRGGP